MSTRASSRCDRSGQDRTARGRLSSSPVSGFSYKREARPGTRLQRHDRGAMGRARRGVLRDLPPEWFLLRGSSFVQAASGSRAFLRGDSGNGRAAPGPERAAVEFAKEKGIAIYARATRGPAPGSDPPSDGTVVRKSPPRMPGTIVGVASERDLLVLDGSAPPADVLALLAERRVPGKQLHVFEGRTTVAISRENLHDEGQLRAALQTRLGGRARLVDSLAALSAIGAGINATYTTFVPVRDAAATESLPSVWQRPLPHHLAGARQSRERSGARSDQRYIEQQRRSCPEITQTWLAAPNPRRLAGNRSFLPSCPPPPCPARGALLPFATSKGSLGHPTCSDPSRRGLEPRHRS